MERICDCLERKPSGVFADCVTPDPQNTKTTHKPPEWNREFPKYVHVMESTFHLKVTTSVELKSRAKTKGHSRCRLSRVFTNKVLKTTQRLYFLFEERVCIGCKGGDLKLPDYVVIASYIEWPIVFPSNQSPGFRTIGGVGVETNWRH